MALISCYECSCQISDKASACPQCGAKTRHEDVSLLQMAIVVLVAAGIAFLFFGSTGVTIVMILTAVVFMIRGVVVLLAIAVWTVKLVSRWGAYLRRVQNSTRDPMPPPARPGTPIHASSEQAASWQHSTLEAQRLRDASRVKYQSPIG